MLICLTEAIDKGIINDVTYLDFAKTLYLTKDLFINYVNMVLSATCFIGLVTFVRILRYQSGNQ